MAKPSRTDISEGPTCATCPAFIETLTNKNEPDYEDGQCRRNAPTPKVFGIDDIESDTAWFPRVGGYFWCMEHPDRAHLMRPRGEK